jgi:hypothetical protein
MSQGKIESAEIEAVSDGGSDVLEPDAGPDLETDNQDSSSEDNEQENGSMEVDESQNNNNEENSNEEEEESEEEEDKFVPLDAKGPVSISDIESEDVELWLLKMPQNFDVHQLIGTKHLRFHKVPHTDGELATVALPGRDDEERNYSIVSADPIEFQTLVNVFPGRDSHKKRRLLLGKPFTKMLTFVEQMEAKIEKKQSEADVLRKLAPVQPEKLYVRYVPPGAKRPEEVPNPILKRKRDSEKDTPNKKAKTSARDTPSKGSNANESGVFKTPEPVARKKSSSNMKDGSTQSTNTSPTKTVESSEKKDKASESAKKDKKDKKDKSSKDKMDVESPKKKDKENKSEDNTPTSSPTKKDKKRKHKSDKKDK